MAGEMKYRLRVNEFTFQHMTDYIEAIGESKNINDNRGYYHFAGMHGAPGRWCWHHQFSRRSNLSARMFLPWHRAYLHRLEQALQDIIPNVAIPWWDWAKETSVPNSFSQPSIKSQPNPLYNSEIKLSPPQVPTPVDELTYRAPDVNAPVFSFPAADVNGDGKATLEEIVNYLINNVTQFEVFNDILEQIHDQMHMHVGGTMSDQTYAAFDPIFYSHHCMIDRIWALWQQIHGVENYPSGLQSVVLEPFGLTAGEVLNIESLGYEYADSVLNINIDGSGIEG